MPDQKDDPTDLSEAAPVVQNAAAKSKTAPTKRSLPTDAELEALGIRVLKPSGGKGYVIPIGKRST